LEELEEELKEKLDIRIQVSKGKTLTIVEYFNSEVECMNFNRKFKKELSCGGCVKEELRNNKFVCIFNGDQRVKLSELLWGKYGYKKSNLQIH
jgi:translation initiation factor 1 (eIF-1/SUI1)